MLIFKGYGRVGGKTVYFYGKRRLATFQEISEQPTFSEFPVLVG